MSCSCRNGIFLEALRTVGKSSVDAIAMMMMMMKKRVLLQNQGFHTESRCICDVVVTDEVNMILFSAE